MQKSGSRATMLCALLGTAASAALITQPVHAQSVPMPPLHRAVDDNGVDMLSGQMALSEADLSVGPAGAGGLSHERFLSSSGWSHAYVIMLAQPVPTTAEIAIGARKVTFTKNGSNWTNDHGSGGSLTVTGSTFTFVDSDGTVYSFDRGLMANSASYDNAYAAGVATSITAPDGTVTTLTYERSSFNWAPGAPASYAVRLKSVRTNAGYQLTYSHGVADLASNGANLSQWWSISAVTAVNLSLDFCAPTADACSPLNQTLRSVTYGAATAPNGSVAEAVTDPLHRVRLYWTDDASRFVVQSPEGTKRSYTTGEDSYVSSVTDGSHTWSYSWYSDGIHLTGHRSDQAGDEITTYAITDGAQLLSYETAAGITHYEYDSYGRLHRVIAPEANWVQYDRDTAGNIITLTVGPKPGTPLSSIVTSAIYPCLSAATCDKPQSTTDANGKTTNWDYDLGTGLLNSITRGAPSPGADRPQVRYFYSPHHAYVKGTSGSLVQEPSAIYKLDSTSECAIGSSCQGSENEAKTTILYGSPGSPNNLLPTSLTVAAGDNSVSATIATTYDAVGNVYGVDGPLAGAADTALTIFDAARQLTEVVSPDPDGPTDPLPNRATVYGYNTDGQITSVARGTAKADGSDFTAVTSALFKYDSTGHKSQESLSAGGSTVSLRQFSYDNAGRLDCATVRMTPSSFAALPEACTPTLPAGGDPDRITKYGYDSNARLTSTTEGHATSNPGTISTQYNPNGTVKSVTDAEGNLTAYEYDRFDRLEKTRFPSPATKGQTLSVEQIGYDANSNVISRTLRDGTAITYDYDDLGRLHVKHLPGGEGDVTYSYDNRSLLTKVSAPPGQTNTIDIHFDALGRKRTETGSRGSVTSSYDPAGRRIQADYAGLSVAWDYTSTGDLVRVRQLGASAKTLVSVGYDASTDAGRLGLKTSVTFGDGSAARYGYDTVQRLSELTQDLVGTPDLNLGITYNSASEERQKTRSGAAYSWGGSFNSARSETPNGLNQLDKIDQIQTTYDLRGNMISDAKHSYTYSAENLLKTGSGAVSLDYDPLRRLDSVRSAGGIGTSFLYDGDDIVAEYDQAGSLLRRYVHGDRQSQPLVWLEGQGAAARRYLHEDELGSVVAVTDDAGTTLGINRYDEFGSPAAGNVGRFQYTGQPWIPELGLYYYQSRIYDPQQGRFLQPDPVGYLAGLNLYSYAGANPVNFVDPSGTYELPPVLINAPGVQRLDRWALGRALETVGTGDAQDRDLDQEARAENDKLAALAPKKAPCFTLNQRREHHDQWVAREVQRLRREGYEVATEVSLRVWTPEHPRGVTARADIIARVPGSGYYVIHEIKTGNADFSRNQEIIYNAPAAWVAGLNGLGIDLKPGDWFPINHFSSTRCKGLG